jgi:hypothetical protein
MEIVIAVFIGLWVSSAAAAAYRFLKKEYKNRMEKNSG